MIACRPATAADYLAYVRLFGELAIPDPVSSAERFAEHVVPQTVMVQDGEVVAGYVTWRRYGTLAHVVNVVVDPARRGRRLGQVLLEHVRSLAAAEGCIRWYLNVKADNAPALALYARCGFTLDHRTWALEMPWSRARRLSIDAGITAGTLAPAEDAAFAARFGLPPERLATFRARGTARLVALRETEAPAGLAVFDPGFPGAAVFAAARPELAGTLLAALDRLALHARFDYVRLTVERDRALAEALLGAGASLTFALLQLGAAI